jgi:hypothetical protein
MVRRADEMSIPSWNASYVECFNSLDSDGESTLYTLLQSIDGQADTVVSDGLVTKGTLPEILIDPDGIAMPGIWRICWFESFCRTWYERSLRKALAAVDRKLSSGQVVSAPSLSPYFIPLSFDQQGAPPTRQYWPEASSGVSSASVRRVIWGNRGIIF